MIPKILHRIWISDKPLPDECLRYGESWRFHHPDWQFFIWTDTNIPPLINHQQFYEAHNFSLRSDILRYEILYRFGGLYVDTDFECLRNIEDLTGDIPCFVGEQEPGYICTALLGATVGHPFLAELIQRLPESMRQHHGDSPVVQTGPAFITECARGRQDIHIFPPDIFYPYHFTEKWRKDEVFPNAYAVHHWAGSWAGQPND